MKIYIAGQITGKPIDEVIDKFNKAEEDLKAAGHEVVNPITLAFEYDRIMVGTDERFPACAEESYRRNSLYGLLECEAIYLLSDWNRSTGAILERKIAGFLGFEVMTA
jgi:hypothetical protein